MFQNCTVESFEELKIKRDEIPTTSSECVLPGNNSDWTKVRESKVQKHSNDGGTFKIMLIVKINCYFFCIQQLQVEQVDDDTIDNIQMNSIRKSSIYIIPKKTLAWTKVQLTYNHMYNSYYIIPCKLNFRTLLFYKV